jgi:hypothetical protein
MEAFTKLLSANRFASANHSNNQPLCRFTFLGLSSRKRDFAARRIKLPSLRRVPPVVLWLDSFLMSRCTRAPNGRMNFCGRGAWEMRRRGILEEPRAAPFCSGAHPLSGNPDAVGAGERGWGVVQPVGHHTVNVDGEGSNPSAPAKMLSRPTLLPRSVAHSCFETAGHFFPRRDHTS